MADIKIRKAGATGMQGNTYDNIPQSVGQPGVAAAEALGQRSRLHVVNHRL